MMLETQTVLAHAYLFVLSRNIIYATAVQNLNSRKLNVVSNYENRSMFRLYSKSPKRSCHSSGG
jgi:hypothetical protein